MWSGYLQPQSLIKPCEHLKCTVGAKLGFLPTTDPLSGIEWIKGSYESFGKHLVSLPWFASVSVSSYRLLHSSAQWLQSPVELCQLSRGSAGTQPAAVWDRLQSQPSNLLNSIWKSPAEPRPPLNSWNGFILYFVMMCCNLLFWSTHFLSVISQNAFQKFLKKTMAAMVTYLLQVKPEFLKDLYLHIFTMIFFSGLQLYRILS